MSLMKIKKPSPEKLGINILNFRTESILYPTWGLVRKPAENVPVIVTNLRILKNATPSGFFSTSKNIHWPKKVLNFFLSLHVGYRYFIRVYIM